MKRSLALALTTLTLAAGCSTAPPDPTEVTIGLTYVPNIQFAPYYVAFDQGYFEEAGLNVTLRHHGQDEDLFGALGQGVEDIVVAGGAEMLQATSNGVEAVTFQTLYATYPVAVIVPEDSDITALTDLRGRTLGIPGRFGETWFGTLAFLAQAGLSEEDVDIIDIGFTQQAALSGGHVDAVVGFANNDVPQFGATGLAVRALPNDPVSVVGVGNGTTPELLADQPEVLTAVAGAISRAVQDIVTDPEIAIAAAHDHIPGAITPEQEQIMREVVARTNELYGPLGEDWGVPDLATWAQMNEFMAQMGLIDTPVSLEQVVTDSITGSE